MRKYINTLVIALSVVCFTSCVTTRTYYENFRQVAQTKSSESSMFHYDKTLNAYLYEDENLRIVYDFWREGGTSRCVISNKTDEVLYIDLDKSFLVKNNISFLYYRPTYTYVKDNDCYKANSSCEPIAPHASITLGGQQFGYTQYMDCDFDTKPKENRPVTVFFTESTSPYVFRSILAYRVGENDTEKFVSNDFFISSITNYRTSDIYNSVRYPTETPCQNMTKSTDPQPSPYVKLLTVKGEHYYSPSTGFYVDYSDKVTEQFKY